MSSHHGLLFRDLSFNLAQVEVGFRAAGQCARAELPLSSNPEVRVPGGIQEASRGPWGAWSPQPLCCAASRGASPCRFLTSSPDRHEASPGLWRAAEWVAGSGKPLQQQLGGRSWTSPPRKLGVAARVEEAEDLSRLGSAGLLQRGAGRVGALPAPRWLQRRPRGRDISGAGRLRLRRHFALAALCTPRPGEDASRAGGRDVGEGEAKGQSDQGQRDLLPCFYFVEVSWPSALA